MQINLRDKETIELISFLDFMVSSLTSNEINKNTKMMISKFIIIKGRLEKDLYGEDNAVD